MRTVWLVCALTSLLASPISGQFKICDIPCCETYPSCSDATSLRCECGGSRTSVTFFGGELPTTLQTILISKARDISIYKLTTDGMLSMKNVTFHDVRSLSIYDGGLKLQRDSVLHSLNLLNIESTSIYTSAFSGHWDNTTTIRMQNIGDLSLYDDAFSYGSTSLGPSLVLDGITRLSLYGSFTNAASISHMTVTAMTISRCSDTIFGPNIAHLELNAVKIDEVLEGCVSGTLAKLYIRSSHLGNVRRRAFTGTMNEIVIDNSYMETVDSLGFQVQVVSLSVSDSSIGSLGSNGLTILAEDSIRFDNIWVANIRTKALAGLRIDFAPNTTNEARPLFLREVRIFEANNGSLVFHEGVLVCLEDLKVRRLRPDLSRTGRWERQLVGGDETSLVTQAQYQVLRQLWRTRADLLRTLSSSTNSFCDALADNTHDDNAGVNGQGKSEVGVDAHSDDEARANGRSDGKVGVDEHNDSIAGVTSQSDRDGEIRAQSGSENDTTPELAQTGPAVQLVLLGILVVLALALVAMVAGILCRRRAPHIAAVRLQSAGAATESRC